MPRTTSTSEQAVVWVWLPQEVTPVPAGVLRRRSDGRAWFRYGRTYLDDPRAISLYEPTLPLRDAWIEPPAGWAIAPNLRDAGPDAWGQRVILDRLHGRRGTTADVTDVDELTYLLRSSSNRVGGLDFQESSRRYVARDETAALDELYDAASALDHGQELTPALHAALESGTGIGGARPKANLVDGGRQIIAKFTSSSDTFPVVQAEAVAIHLAGAVGIAVPRAEVVRSRGRWALVVERFDRTPDGARRLVVSGLTMTGLTESTARVGTYPELVDVLRAHGAGPAVGEDVFRRVAFNIAISNNDDHLRNHAAFWDGHRLALTPAYDLSPGARSGNTMFQAIAYGRDGQRESRLATLVSVAAEYGLTAREAHDVVEHLVETIDARWDEACDAARLTRAEAASLHRRQFLHRSVFFDLGKYLKDTEDGPQVSI
ncbi:type II toxin-antitoxin system HipA family toxin [Cellulosimicrobium marinum]|uniref:type II toxin-antitoxin system HipA family toxin n=1 Tax=Cellulosimicrobium marinum TaxID=1638992 RepID=UPI001E616864|nr:type II toxin-antitoxin system HipA family toxin [Cellulosimicrobium marinum]MCB7135690.1 type II toxin-antitoxin system HipA family toxin [Cellulosimicrobium marinum]